jgi:predicted DCC family thiol-disulfide oxidoreductase YuxK
MIEEPNTEDAKTDHRNLTVYYDGSCPLCTREIGLYKRLGETAAVDFVDISQTTEALVAPGLTRDDAMKRFHVMRPDGRLSSGGPAFAHLWAALPRLAAIGRVLQRKPFPCLMDGAYTIFLPLRPILQHLARALDRR